MKKDRLEVLKGFLAEGKLIPDLENGKLYYGHSGEECTSESNDYYHCLIAVGKRPNRKLYTFYVHEVMAYCYFGDSIIGMTVNHIDGDKHHNTRDNLECITAADNHIHAWETGLCPKRTYSKLTELDVIEIRKLLAKGDLTQGEIGKLFGVDNSTISRIKRNIDWKSIK